MHSLSQHLASLKQLGAVLESLDAQSEQASDTSHQLFLERYQSLIDTLGQDLEEGVHLGQELLAQIAYRYPEVAHLISRELLWFFGGDCLYLLSDEEALFYQERDEQRFIQEQTEQGRS